MLRMNFRLVDRIRVTEERVAHISQKVGHPWCIGYLSRFLSMYVYVSVLYRYVRSLYLYLLCLCMYLYVCVHICVYAYMSVYK